MISFSDISSSFVFLYYIRKHKENILFNKLLSPVNGSTSHHLLKSWHRLFFAPFSNISACPASQYVQSLTLLSISSVTPTPQPSCALAWNTVTVPFLLPLLLPTVYFHIVAKVMFFETRSHHGLSLLGTFK